MAREKRTFTDDEIATALATLRSNGGNAKRTAVQLGIPRTTLRQWAGRAKSSTASPRKVAALKVDVAAEKLAASLDEVSARGTAKVLAAIDSVPLETAADVRNLLVGVGIATEKASFARGGPTSRTESLRVSLVSPDELRASALRVIEGGKRTDPPSSEGAA